MSRFASGRFRLAVCIPVLLLAVGCQRSSGKGVHVSGHVTLDGKPLDAGSISFTNVGGKAPQTGGKIVQGQYSVDNVTPGKNQISVQGGVRGSEGAGGGGRSDYAQHMQREHRAAQMAGMGKENPQKAARMAQEASRGDTVVSDKTMGNNQVQEITSENNQTIDINLMTLKPKSGQ
jgi:hypothetical protein